MQAVPLVSIDQLIGRYSAFFLDAYGVLVTEDGALPGARELLKQLTRKAKPFYVLTNDATKPPVVAATRYQAFGLPITPEHIVSSGGLLPGYFRAHGLQGKACRVLGPAGSLDYVIDAGGRIAQCPEPFEVLVVADQTGFPFLEVVDSTLTEIFKRIDGREPLHLLLPNPDLIYPTNSGFGITSGSIALLIEAAIRARYPSRTDIRFRILGKPQPDLFLEALRRCGTENVLMIGDQLTTDIAGAKASGVDSALLLGGVSALADGLADERLRPDYLLESLNPGDYQ